MKKFLLRILIIVALTFALERPLGYLAGFFYKTTTTTDEYKLNQATYEMDDPIVFMGSSRCHHHYIPTIIQDTFKKDVYNAGLWGMRNIYFQYALLHNILKRYTPKVIFLEIHPIDYLQIPVSTVETVVRLTPFTDYTEECNEVLKKADFYYKCKLSELYRYNSEFAFLLIGNISVRTPPEFKGFKPLYGKLDTTIEEIKPESFPYPGDKDRLHYLQAFIDICKEKNIKLVFLVSPMYNAGNYTELFRIPDSLAKKNNIPFFNHYGMDGITNHSEYFHDFGHLNEEGAKKYSSMIASELKQFVE